MTSDASQLPDSTLIKRWKETAPNELAKESSAFKAKQDDAPYRENAFGGHSVHPLLAPRKPGAQRSQKRPPGEGEMEPSGQLRQGFAKVVAVTLPASAR